MWLQEVNSLLLSHIPFICKMRSSPQGSLTNGGKDSICEWILSYFKAEVLCTKYGICVSLLLYHLLQSQAALGQINSSCDLEDAMAGAGMRSTAGG